MDLFTIMVIGDEQSPVRRFHVPKIRIQRMAALAAVVGLLISAAIWDYWRLRSENSELPVLRHTSGEQAAEIRRFHRALEVVESELVRVQELERKVRIIANLPGASSAGGGEVTQLAPDEDGRPLALPTGVPSVLEGIDGFDRIDRVEAPDVRTGHSGLGRGGPEPGEALVREGELDFDAMHLRAGHLGDSASLRSRSLDELVAQLEVKSSHLASMPSVWPVRGWLTSRFGARISPFTARRHMHTGIDVATRHGAPIIAPARGLVTFVGRKGPLGKSVVLDHGFGVRTFFGHASETHVKTGERVERGQLIAAVGNTGRSTGPHLHYTVEVNGKPQDPLDYILD